MWNPDTERQRLQADIARSWTRAQRCVWHSAEWNSIIDGIDAMQLDLGRLHRLHYGEQERPAALRLVSYSGVQSAPS